MNDQPGPTPTPAPTTAPVAPDYPFPLRFYAQLTHPLRIWILRQLAQGKELSPKHVAAAHGRKYRAVNLHCQSLHEAGLVSWRPGEDRRWDIYFIPEQFRREPGWLDYGSFALTALSAEAAWNWITPQVRAQRRGVACGEGAALSGASPQTNHTRS